MVWREDLDILAYGDQDHKLWDLVAGEELFPGGRVFAGDLDGSNFEFITRDFGLENF